MGSPSFRVKQGSYVGQTDALEVKCGFQPKHVSVVSINGKALTHEGMDGTAKDVDGANPTFLTVAAGIEVTTTGFKLPAAAGADDVVNKAGDTYYYEAW